MEQARDMSFRTKSIQLAAALAVSLLSVCAVLPAQAQITAYGTGALESNTTGINNAAFGDSALFSNTTGNANTALGSGALANSIAGTSNTATGADALYANTSTVGFNTADGSGALGANTTGEENTATGAGALAANITGSKNAAVGASALRNNYTGSNNIAVGYRAGNFIMAGSNNIDIGYVGNADESNTIRIGINNLQTKVVIAGISNSAVIGWPVYVNSNGRLGVQPSSARFKRDVRDMGGASNGLMKLRPVMFRYKEDPSGARQYGLIAEEVERVYPELVMHDEDGKVEGVRYDLLPALLLNEMKRHASQNRRNDARIVALQRQVVAQQRQIDALQKETAEVDKLTARLNALEMQARSAKPESLVSAIR
jgi:hypothetical protein